MKTNKAVSLPLNYQGREVQSVVSQRWTLRRRLAVGTYEAEVVVAGTAVKLDTSGNGSL